MGNCRGRVSRRACSLACIDWPSPFHAGGTVPTRLSHGFCFGTQGENKGFQVCKRKMVSSAEVLCKYNPEPFKKFTEFVLNLKFDEEPKYWTCIALFQQLIDGPAERPIQIDAGALRVRPHDRCLQPDRGSLVFVSCSRGSSRWRGRASCLGRRAEHAVEVLSYGPERCRKRAP